MANWRFWEEETRSFPAGGPSVVLWVVRQEGVRPHCTLRLMYTFGWLEGQAVQLGNSYSAGDLPPYPSPPFTSLQRVLRTGEAEEIDVDNRALGMSSGADSTTRHSERNFMMSPARSAGRRLWAEPLSCDGVVAGAMAIWYSVQEPWAEAVRLWGRRFALRLGPVLPVLPPWLPAAPERFRLAITGVLQPTLFPLANRPGPAESRVRRGLSDSRLLLPRPVFIPGVPGVVGISREMRRCCELVQKAAASGVNVLLHGESGTGKEIIARAIHLGSDRRHGPLLGQNCAALPETLFESELFGHKSGAFTGATTDKIGLLEAANGGTFFLDEIGDMPQALQIKLLRVMQERRVRRIGELKSRPVDLRFIAATHQNLEEDIKRGRFRLDLFYRLKVIKITIPPLRQRPEDIAHLVAYFLGRHGKRQHGKLSISDQALAAMQAYRWPGNVRELENEVCRLLALFNDEPHIHLAHLSDEVRAATTGEAVDPADLATLRKLDEAGELLERYLIRKAIAATGGRKAAAARRLGLSRQGLYKKIQRYGMTDLIAAPAR